MHANAHGRISLSWMRSLNTRMLSGCALDIKNEEKETGICLKENVDNLGLIDNVLKEKNIVI